MTDLSRVPSTQAEWQALFAEIEETYAEKCGEYALAQVLDSLLG